MRKDKWEKIKEIYGGNSGVNSKLQSPNSKQIQNPCLTSKQAKSKIRFLDRLEMTIKSLASMGRWKKATLMLGLAVIITGAGFLWNIFNVRSASYSWMQTTWTGGADTVNFPTHTSNQTGWTKYYSKDSNVDVTTSPGDAKLTQASSTSVQTSDTGTGDTPNAGGFNAWTKTNAYVSGTGTGASLALLKPLGATCSTNAECAVGTCCGGICSASTFTFNGLTYGVVTANSQCWMDRNLGATQVATAYNDSNAYGWLFQWGRLTDGHQIRTSGTTTSLSSSDTPGHANFIYGMGSPYDWRSPQNDSLSTIWGGVNGTSSPCPTGWRLPTQTEWASVVSALGITNYTTAYSSVLKLTAGGYRDYSSASLSNVGSNGYYWSSTVTGTNAYFLSFASSSVTPANFNYRAYGFSVRCLRN